ncbi:Glucose-repressible protein [Cytospora paraplurivora]|uniref:Glucose-repressible protein n=1 Tax=Cytospora paraplurivora TaxID=2898453 RepID=A0AAN9TWG3_9PEZI
METIKNTANYVADKVQGTGHEASKEANKNVAKDSNVSLGNRAEAGVDAVKDKAHESKSDASAETNKQKATH